MMKRWLFLMATAATINLGVQAEAVAQISLPGMRSQSSSTPPPPDMSAAQSGLVGSFNAAYIDIATAQAYLMDALNEREAASALRTQVNTIRGGAADRDALRRATELSQEANSTIQERLAAGAALEANGQALFVQSLPYLVSGTRGAIGLPGQASTFASNSRAALSSAGMLERAQLTQNLAAGTYLASNIPGFVSTTVDTYRKVFSFANANRISVPAEGTALLGRLE